MIGFVFGILLIFYCFICTYIYCDQRYQRKRVRIAFKSALEQQMIANPQKFNSIEGNNDINNDANNIEFMEGYPDNKRKKQGSYHANVASKSQSLPQKKGVMIGY